MTVRDLLTGVGLTAVFVALACFLSIALGGAS